MNFTYFMVYEPSVINTASTRSSRVLAVLVKNKARLLYVT